MGFLTPLMLFGALAAGIPVAIHFFFRSRYRTVPWAAMKFLLTSVEQTSRRLKFQELLLLLLRMAVLILLAMAFARPISSMMRGSGRGEAVDAVFVFDVSFSMGANDGPKTRFERAKEEALKIIDELPANSTVQIVTCAGKNATVVDQRSPANLDQVQKLVQGLELTHLATDLQPGVAEAKAVLKRGQSSNQELYVFSDMQKLGWDQQAGELKRTLQEIKEKALVTLVRCGTRPLKNAAIVRIVAQSDMPRPGERVGFAVHVRNTTSEPLENLTVTLMVDGDEKNVEPATIASLPPRTTRVVTLNVKLEKPGLRILTARIKPDDLDGDNRFDQVILVRDQVNILVVDGNYQEKDAEKASSYYLMHTLLPVPEPARAAYKLNPSVVSARLASPALLKNQDLCILVNVALQAKLGSRADVLPADFLEALDPFVRKEGHGLIVFSGDNTQPEAYNKLLGKKLGLLPLPLKSVTQARENNGKSPFKINRKSFADAPAAFQRFKDDKYFEDFDEVEVWQYVEMDEKLQRDIENLHYRFYHQAGSSLPDFGQLTAVEKGTLPSGLFDLSQRKLNKDFGFVFEGVLVVPEDGDYTFFLDAADGARLSVSGTAVLTYDGLHEMGSEQTATVRLSKGKQPIKVEYFHHTSRPGLAVAWSGPGFGRRPLSVGREENPLNVVVRLNNERPLVVSKKVDAGEVMFIATSAHNEGRDPKTLDPFWSDFVNYPKFIPFMDTAINHLLHGQTQTYNLVAGESLTWQPTGKVEALYDLHYPEGGKIERLKPPEKIGKRYVVTASDFPRGGIYRITTALPQEGVSTSSTATLDTAGSGTPIAVVPDLRESEDLSTLPDAQLDELIGFEPIHITAGDAGIASTGTERLNREWTVWVLLAVLGLVLGETLLAWWCGRAW